MNLFISHIHENFLRQFTRVKDLLFVFKKSFISLCLIWVPGLVALNAQPLKRLYLANDDHTDYMWTANEAKYDSAFVHMLDYYLDQIDSTASHPSDFQARFNCDGSYWLKVYEKYRSPAQYNRLISRIRSGHISSPLNSVVSTYGAQPTEAVIRGMYDAGHMERKLGLRFKMAVCMENQTLPLGLSSLWAGSGAKYSWRGVCGCASRISNESLAHRRHQLYNYLGLDSTGVLMKWYNRPISNGRTLGGYAEARREKKPTDAASDMELVIKDLDAMSDTISQRAAYPYNVSGAFGFGWDDLETYVSPAFINAAKLGTTGNRKVRVSNEEDFFEDVIATYPKLPAESVSYGNEWDTYCASMNETTARVRRATEKLRSAEALASIVSLKDKSFADHLLPARDRAWEAFGLYWEHDWTADGPVPQNERAKWQIKLQEQISGYTEALYDLSSAKLGSQIKKSTAERFYVFNPLSWVRTDFADIAFAGNYPVKVIDLVTNKEMASQLITKGGKKYIRIKAENIPSVGYKLFEIRQGQPMKLPLAAKISGKYISNNLYRICLSASGAITEIYDSLANGRQLVKPFSGKYLNDLGTSDLNDGGALVVENAGPVSVTFKAVSKNPVLHTVRVTLFANSPRIEIDDSIQANFKDLKLWAFSFNLNKPSTHHEELGAILTAKKETRGGNYAAQNARYDWQTFNHFVDMSENGYGVTLSNVDCSFFKLGNSTPDSLWEESSQLNALAGGQTDRYTLKPTGWKDTLMLGIYNQYGQTDFHYQFALTTHRAGFDAASAMRFSLEHQNPLVAASITGDQTAVAANEYSLINISDANVLLWSIKPSEEGVDNGLIARLWNMKNQPAEPTIKLSKAIKSAWQVSHIETNEKTLQATNGSLPVHFKMHQINSFRIVPALDKE